MHVVGTTLLDEFIRKHADALRSIQSWLSDAKAAEWRSPSDIKERYAAASLLPGNVVVFNIKGNKYRLAAQVNYTSKLVLVLRCGTHSEYDRWNI